MGRSGRKAVSERLKSLREKWRLDFDPEEADEIAEEIRSAAASARANARK